MNQFKDKNNVLIIGGGIAGITAAVDLANAGYPVHMVERQPSIGGRMLQLSETFPTLDCAQCTLTPRTVETGQHAGITLHTYCEIEDIQGESPQFQVTVKRKPAYVDWDVCTGCGLCSEKCPAKIPSAFEREAGKGKAIYTLSPQAVPNKPVIDPDYCRMLTQGKCGVCAKVCPTEAIDYNQKASMFNLEAGAIIIATGFDVYDKHHMSDYCATPLPDVIDSLTLERFLSASGPTAGVLKRPSDGKVPKRLVFIQCAGSRDPEFHKSYCSRICCMYTAKHAKLYKHKVPDGEVFVFYIDIRATGKGYEQFIQQAQEEDRIVYIRGKVSKIYKRGEIIVVKGADTLSGNQIEVETDMVVLAMAIEPSSGNKRLAEMLGVTTDDWGFFRERDYKLGSNETERAGIFLAGMCQGSRDIADATAHASSAAGKVQVYLEKRKQKWAEACQTE
jgi:heterodisulfide reductase subunit A